MPDLVALLRVLPPRAVGGRHRGELRVFGYAHQTSFSGHWRAACKAAGLDYRSKYEAGRHSHFTETIVRNGADIPTACKIGNISPAVALRRYAHAEKLERLAHEIFGTKSTQARVRKSLKVLKGTRS